MTWCIPGHLVDAFKQKLVSGEINPDTLANMTSAERRDFLAGILGEDNAQKANVLFESKLLLKNQQRGMVTWAETIMGMRPRAKTDIISKINRMEKILTPETEDAFLSDLAAQRLGIAVTAEEAGNLMSLAKNVFEARQEIDSTNGSQAARNNFGEAKVAFDDYLSDLKNDAAALELDDYLHPKTIGGAASNVGGLITKGAGLAKSLKASLDNSILFRQGLKVLTTHPSVWLKSSAQSFTDIYNSFNNKEVLREVRAEIFSRDNYLNGLYKEHGLDVGVTEEAFPTHAPAHIPVLGRFFKASEAAFTAWQYRTRADVFDMMHKQLTKAGADPKGLGIIVNSLTGRGSLDYGKLGNFEKMSGTVNNIFFSPRFLRSNIDALSAHAIDVAQDKMSNAVAKEAAKNTLKHVVAIGILMSIAAALDPDSVEWDSRSSDFGKIKVGNTRFDVSGGMAGIVVLAARMFSGKSKSSVTHIISELDSNEYGAMTRWDVITNFFANKLSPMASVIKDNATGRTFSGQDPTLGRETVNLLAPIIATNYIEIKDDPNSANMIIAMIADGLGIGTNTYSYKSDWTTNRGVELNQFKEKVGDTEFKKANDQYNKEVNSWIQSSFKDKEYNSLSEEDKQKSLAKAKDKIKDRIFRQYHFKYKRRSK